MELLCNACYKFSVLHLITKSKELPLGQIFSTLLPHNITDGCQAWQKCREFSVAAFWKLKWGNRPLNLHYMLNLLWVSCNRVNNGKDIIQCQLSEESLLLTISLHITFCCSFLLLCPKQDSGGPLWIDTHDLYPQRYSSSREYRNNTILSDLY